MIGREAFVYNAIYNSSNSNVLSFNPLLDMPLAWKCNKPVQIRVNKPKKVSPKKVVDIAYTYIDALTGKEIGLSKIQLLKLGRIFMIFTRESQCLFVKTFWEGLGINHEIIEYWCQQEPEFKRLFKFGIANVKHSRTTLALGDIVFIRKLAPLYVKEWREYDIEMLELKANIRAMV